MAPPTPSLLDFTQILQRVFNEPEGKLRVDSTATVVAGSIECIIDQADDSIRIGDGTNLVTTTSSGGKVALDVNVVSAASVTTPFIENFVVVAANTEVSLAIPDNTQNLIIKSRLGKLQIAFAAGQTFTKYLTLNKGANYVLDNLRTSSLTLYLQSTVAGDIVEVHGWST